MDQDGTLTRAGYCWICVDCKNLFFIASDNIVLTECPGCGGKVRNAPRKEALDAAADIIASHFKPTSRSSVHGKCKTKKPVGLDKVM